MQLYYKIIEAIDREAAALVAVSAKRIADL